MEDRILNLAQAYDLNPERIKIEITESAIMANYDESQKKMQALKEKGYKLSIDDFGTGQASLAYLKDFPIDEIKIDRVFIQNFVTQKVDFEIVKHIIGLAHTLNLTTVAEGVEEEQQVKLLESLGCDVIQGYYFSKPISKNEMCKLLLTQPFRRSSSR
ncbi:EAL domain-containing protein (fragment) [Candidatus Desulfosporosinus infrequens]|uniref:EAL domain-containing protein n=1 Tax=Candidatus Desulfosporosinus infrequens TaxID=2043169 RepID=A0A2U3JZM7_9FIRM